MQSNHAELFVLSLLLMLWNVITLWRNKQSTYQSARFLYISITLTTLMTLIQIIEWYMFHEQIDLLISIILVTTLFIIIWKGRQEEIWQRKMREVDTHYQELIESSSNPVIIEADKKIVYINTAGLRFFAVPSTADLIGKKVTSFFEGQLQTEMNNLWHFSEIVIHKGNGERAIVEMFVNEIKFRGIQAVKYILNDVTEKREAEQKLEAFFTNSADPMYILSLDSVITQVNPAFAKLVGEKEEDLRGSSIDTWCNMNQEKRTEYLQKVEGGSVVCGIESFLKKRDGNLVSVSITLSPIRDSDSKVTMISGVIRDTTVQKKYEQALQESEHRYRMIAEYASDYLMMLTPLLKPTFISPKIVDLVGYTPDEVMNMPFLSVIHKNDIANVEEKIDHMLQSHTSIMLEYRVGSKRNEWIWMEVRMIPVLNLDDEIDYILLLAKDIRERKAYEAQLKRMAFVDPLTGIANRRSFEEQAQELMDVNTPFALCYLDFDNFKWINDSFSHECGDMFLKEVAHRLQLVIRSSDFAARLGGDEFALILPNLQEEEISRIANRIIRAFRGPIIFQDQSIVSTVSIGISLFPKDGEKKEELLRHADAALYQVKGNGGNTYYFYNHSEKMDRKKKMESSLSFALANGELELVYRPQMDTLDDRIIGMEAIIRWKHPDLGEILSHEFIPIAEEQRLIHDITLWWIREACIQIKKWNRAYNVQMKIAVHLSSYLLDSDYFFEELKELLQDISFPPSELILEVTEKGLISNLSQRYKVLNKIQSYGVSIAMEDFSTGFCSIAHIRELQIPLLKIDKSYLHKIKRNTRDMTYVHAIAQIGNSFGISALTNGIKEGSKREFIKDIDSQVQDLYSSKTLPPHEAEEWVRTFHQSFV